MKTVPAEKAPKRISAPAVTTHGESTAVYIVDDDSSHRALHLRAANFVGKRARPAVNDGNFSGELRRGA